MSTLSMLLGLDGAKLDLQTIAAALSGGKVENLTVERSGGLARRLYDRHIARMVAAGPDELLQYDCDFAEITEIFLSSAGRAICGDVTLLGLTDSEAQQGDEVDLWLASGWWQPVALCYDWQLHRHAAHGYGCALYRLEYTDEGFTMSYWFFVEQY